MVAQAKRTGVWGMEVNLYSARTSSNPAISSNP